MAPVDDKCQACAADDFGECPEHPLIGDVVKILEYARDQDPLPPVDRKKQHSLASQLLSYATRFDLPQATIEMQGADTWTVWREGREGTEYIHKGRWRMGQATPFETFNAALHALRKVTNGGGSVE